MLKMSLLRFKTEIKNMLLVTKGKMILVAENLTELCSFGWKVKILSDETGHRAEVVTSNQLGGKAWPLPVLDSKMGLDKS